MSAYMDEDSEVCFVFQEDEEAKHSTTKLKDLAIGDPFIFRGQRFTKRNNMGWGFGVCNIADEQDQVSHLHPTTPIQLIH